MRSGIESNSQSGQGFEAEGKNTLKESTFNNATDNKDKMALGLPKIPVFLPYLVN